MGKISLNNIRVHAHHGCLKEESIIGSDYRVDLSITSDLSAPSKSDKLAETVDYVHLNNIVKQEMEINTALQKLVQRFESARCLKSSDFFRAFF